MAVQCVFIPSRFWLWTFCSAWAFYCGVCKLYVCTGFLSMNWLFNDGPACHDAQNLPLQGSQLSLHLSQMSFPAGGLQEGTPVSLFMKRHWSLYTSSSSGLFPPCFGFLIRFKICDTSLAYLVEQAIISWKAQSSVPHSSLNQDSLLRVLPPISILFSCLVFTVLSNKVQKSPLSPSKRLYP